jgi:hypothetical protein
MMVEEACQEVACQEVACQKVALKDTANVLFNTALSRSTCINKKAA